jgi:hypothetical protein
MVTLTSFTPPVTETELTGGFVSGGTLIPTGPQPVIQGFRTSQDVFAPYSGTKIVLCGDPMFTMVEELTDDVEGTPFDSSGVRTYIRRFRVTAKINFVGPAGICQCPGIPRPFSPYIPGRPVESDLQAKAVRIQARRENPGDWQNWIVTVSYSVQLGAFPFGPQNEPWYEAPYLRVETEDTQDTPEVDRNGRAYLNTVGQPFTPPPSFPGGMAGLIIRRNERHFTLDSVLNQVETFNYAVNSIPWLGRGAGKILCKVESAEEVYRGDLRYWVFVYRLRFKKLEKLPDGKDVSTWQPRILNAGMYRWKKVFGVPLKDAPIVPIMRGALPISYPVPLDLDGQPCVPNPTTGRVTPTYLNFVHYRELDLSSLVLPAGKL